MRRIATLVFSMLAVTAAAQTPVPITPGTTQVFAWDMEPLNDAAVMPDAFRLCVDATCTPIAGATYAATMSTPIPAMTPGRHTIRVQACKTYPAPRGEVCEEASLAVEMLVVTSPAQPSNLRLGTVTPGGDEDEGDPMPDPVLVQQTTIAHGSDTRAFPGNVTAGNCIVVFASKYQGDMIATDVSGTVNGASFVMPIHLQRGGTGDERVALFYKVNISGGAETMSMANAGAGLTWIAAEFSGVETVSPEDDTASNSATGVATTGNMDATTASTLLLAALTHNGGNDTITPGASMTEVGEEEDNNAFQSLSAIYRVLTASGTFSGDWSTSHTYGAVGLLLKGTGGGGGGGGNPWYYFAQQ